jgi:hypothetical protein
MTAILSALLNFLTNHFGATKIILYGLFVMVLPVILWNAWVEVVSFGLNLLFSTFQGISTPSGGFGFSFSSIGAFAVWLGSSLRLQEAFVAFISGISIRLTVDLVMRLIIK